MASITSIFRRKSRGGEPNPSAWVDNILSRRFVRTRQTSPIDETRVAIMVPRFDGKILGRYLMPILKKPEFPINLDEMGSFVWEACDGIRTGEDILDLLEVRFSNTEQPRQRLALFLRALALQGHLGEALGDAATTSMNVERESPSTSKDFAVRP